MEAQGYCHHHWFNFRFFIALFEVDIFLLGLMDFKEMPSDKKTIAIQVECYAGYKADEKPIGFILDSKKFIVEKIIDQWRSPEFEYFKVLADDGKGYLLRNDERNGEWVLEKIFDL